VASRPALFGKAGRGNAFFHETDIVHHADASIEYLEYLVDLHAAVALAVAQDGIADYDAACRVDHGDARLCRWSPWFGTEIALIAAVVASAILDSIVAVVRDPIAAMKTVAAGIVISLYRFVVCKPLEVTSDDAVTSAFIVSGYAEPGERAKLHRNAFQAAERAGVRHLIYLSTLGASPHSRFPMSRDHYQSEQFLKATGVPNTILQDSFYSELAVQMFNEEGVMKGPGGLGKVSWVGREEIAEAAAKLLASDSPLLGTFPVTGPTALSLHETAALLGSLKKQPLRYEDEPIEEAKEWRSKLGVPQWEVDTWVGSYEAIAAGEFERVDPTLSVILERPAMSLEEYLSVLLTF
jgi:NAD(P)H dehydrogenase (quinone)